MFKVHFQNSLIHVSLEFALVLKQLKEFQINSQGGLWVGF